MRSVHGRLIRSIKQANLKSAPGLSIYIRPERKLSLIKKEPSWLLEFRLKALEVFLGKKMPSWGVDLSGVDSQGLEKVKEKLSKFPGKTPVYLRLNTQNYKSVQILVGEDLFVAPDENLMEELRELIGEEKFSMMI